MLANVTGSTLGHGMVAVAGALPMETAGILRLGKRFSHATKKGFSYYYGDIRGTGAAVFVTGIGYDRAYRTAKAACDTLPISAYISIGLSGSLTPDLLPGGIVIGTSTTQYSSGQPGRSFSSDPALLEAAYNALAGSIVYHHGPLVATDRVAVTAAAKMELAASSGAVAVDMESAGAARAAAEAGIPFLAIRAISDGLAEDLPVDFNRFTASGSMDYASLILHVITHPASIPGLIRLGRKSHAAASALTSALNLILSGNF